MNQKEKDLTKKINDQMIVDIGNELRILEEADRLFVMTESDTVSETDLYTGSRIKDHIVFETTMEELIDRGYFVFSHVGEKDRRYYKKGSKFNELVL